MELPMPSKNLPSRATRKIRVVSVRYLMLWKVREPEAAMSTARITSFFFSNKYMYFPANKERKMDNSGEALKMSPVSPWVSPFTSIVYWARNGDGINCCQFRMNTVSSIITIELSI